MTVLNLSPDKLSNVLVVVRSAHERTEHLSASLAREQVPEEHVVVIHERPFSQAVRRSFEIGLDFGLDWTLCLDADILIRKGALRALVSRMESLGGSFFELDALLLDKLLGRPRTGMHLYRTSLFSRALQYVDASADHIRPESFVKRQMKEQGFPHDDFQETILGLHDYEQYYYDIYRKAIVHAHKSARSMSYVIAMWQRLARLDMDYRVALWGYRAGSIFEGKITIDRFYFPREIDVLLQLLGVEEKGMLDESEWFPDRVDKVISEAVLSTEYLTWKAEESQDRSFLGRLKLAQRKLGYSRFLLWLASKALYRTARKLETWIEE